MPELAELSESESKSRSFDFDRCAIFAQDDRVLVEAEAAIDNERLAGDEVGAGGKEEDGLSDVVRVAVAAHGSFGGEAGGLQVRPGWRASRMGSGVGLSWRLRSTLPATP